MTNQKNNSAYSKLELSKAASVLNFFYSSLTAFVNMASKFLMGSSFSKLLRQTLFSTKLNRFFELRNFPISGDKLLSKEKAATLSTCSVQDIFWFHVASAGELEQAIPICHALINKYTSKVNNNGNATGNTVASEVGIGAKSVGFVVSYFSPSAEPFLKGVPNLVCSVGVPWDSAKEQGKLVEFVLNKWNVLGMFFVRYDIWPNLLLELKKRGIEIHLIAATRNAAKLSNDEKKSFFAKIAWISRLWYLKNLYTQFNTIFVTEECDIAFFKSFGCAAQVFFAGDPKWSRAQQRAKTHLENAVSAISTGTINQDSAANSHVKIAVLSYISLQKQTGAKIILFGSPHKEEREIAFQLAISLPGNSATVIAAPPELDSGELQKWHSQALAYGVQIQLATEFGTNKATLSNIASNDIRASGLLSKPKNSILLLNTMGMLADLYSQADIAVIGGGFDGQLHNTLEPASFGVPVLCGPKLSRAPEAIKLRKNEALIIFNNLQEMFQFLCSCVRIKEDSSEHEKSEEAQTLLNAANSSKKLFASIPNTSEIVSSWVLRES